jgi:hypothetical protein
MYIDPNPIGGTYFFRLLDLPPLAKPFLKDVASLCPHPRRSARQGGLREEAALGAMRTRSSPARRLVVAARHKARPGSHEHMPRG